MLNVSALTEAAEKMMLLFSETSVKHGDSVRRNATDEHLRHHDQRMAFGVLLLIPAVTLALAAQCLCAILLKHSADERHRVAVASNAVEQDEEDDSADELIVDPPLKARGAGASSHATKKNCTFMGPLTCEGC